MRFNRIVVPVDGSDHALKALELACDLQAKYDGAELYVLSVYQHVSLLESSHSLVRTREQPVPPDEALKRIAREIVNDSVTKAKAWGATGVIGVVKRGKPSRTILDFAKEKKADCIIMGGRGLGDVGGVLLGSVSHKVSSLATCTCITVK